MKTLKKIIFISVISLFFLNLSNCGTLGGIGKEIYFPVSKERLSTAIMLLYRNHPEYIIPKKWEMFNSWKERGYDFLESFIFYFRSQPEEMYYITFIDDGTTTDTGKIGIGIRAVNQGGNKWFLDNELNSKEKQRIISRFKKEIISKLEIYTKTESFKE